VPTGTDCHSFRQGPYDASHSGRKGTEFRAASAVLARPDEECAKINSGDPVSIAEVVRDLHRNADQPDQSYSERQIYQAALDRLVREFAAVEDLDENAATEKLEAMLKAA
jgi:RNA polymerase-interacting CarD/CdnL/TRCF family regulator